MNKVFLKPDAMLDRHVFCAFRQLKTPPAWLAIIKDVRWMQLCSRWTAGCRTTPEP